MAQDLFARSILLANLVEFHRRPMGAHAAKLEDETLPVEYRHGISEPNKQINLFTEKGVLRDRQPNFFRIGFQAQAFIDILLKSSSKDAERSAVIEHAVKDKLKEIENIIQIYTVFGDVDLRCAVVGLTLRDIEAVAMKIRSIPGVQSSSTSIILDDTEYDHAPQRWARLIRDNAEKIDHFLPTVASKKKA